MTESLPLSYNDVDFSFKIARLGLRRLWIANARAYHFESKSRVPTVQPWERDYFLRGGRRRDRDVYVRTYGTAVKSTRRVTPVRGRAVLAEARKGCTDFQGLAPAWTRSPTEHAWCSRRCLADDGRRPGHARAVRGMVLLHERDYTPLSPVEKLQHIDYLDQASRFDLVRTGEHVGEVAMREQACRTVDSPGFVSPAPL